MCWLKKCVCQGWLKVSQHSHLYYSLWCLLFNRVLPSYVMLLKYKHVCYHPMHLMKLKKALPQQDISHSPRARKIGKEKGKTLGSKEV